MVMDLKLILRISPLLLLLSGTSAAFNLPELDGGKLLLNKDKTGVFLACTNWSTFFYFVSKPVDFERFMDVIRQIDNFFITVVELPR